MREKRENRLWPGLQKTTNDFNVHEERNLQFSHYAIPA
jgi:hypothetical protein